MKFLNYANYISYTIFRSNKTSNLHELMTNEELQLVFNSDQNETNELNYEVLPVFYDFDNRNDELVQTRASPKVTVNTSNKNYSLYLENNDRVLVGTNTKIYMAKRLNGSDIQYTPMDFKLPTNFEVYHDVEHQAAVTIYKDGQNRTHINGIIGDDIIIRSLPDRIHNEVLYNHPNLVTDRVSIFGKNYTHHAVLKRSTAKFFDNESVDSMVDRIAKPEAPADKHEKENSQLVRSQRSADNNDTMYPEILVITDFFYYNAVHKKNIDKLAKYMVAFWNTVDLRFRQITNLKVRLNIAGLIVPETREAVPYINGFTGVKGVSFGNFLKDLKKYHNKFPIKNYDVIVGIIYQKIISNYSAIGVAHVGQICSVKNEQALAFVIDNGSFGRVNTAAYELAHTMNARHDGQETAKPCPPKGNILGGNYPHANGFGWSDCSIADMKKFFASKSASCLRNKPDIGVPYKKILSGNIMNRDQQCQKSRKGRAVRGTKYVKNCYNLYCYLSITNENYMVKHGLPAEGTNCGNGKICLRGQCVDDPEKGHY